MIEHGVALARIFGQPIQVAHALLGQVPVLRALGEHKAATAAIADARSVLNLCPDPGILAATLPTLERAAQVRRGLSEDGESDAKGARGTEAPAQRFVRARYRSRIVRVVLHGP